MNCLAMAAFTRSYGLLRRSIIRILRGSCLRDDFEKHIACEFAGDVLLIICNKITLFDIYNIIWYNYLK